MNSDVTFVPIGFLFLMFSELVKFLMLNQFLGYKIFRLILLLETSLHSFTVLSFCEVGCSDKNQLLFFHLFNFVAGSVVQILIIYTDL